MQTTAEHRWQIQNTLFSLYALTSTTVLVRPFLCLFGCFWVTGEHAGKMPLFCTKQKITYASNNAAVTQARNTLTVESQSFWTWMFRILVLLFQPFASSSNKLGVRSHVWQVRFPRSPATAHITVSSVKLCPSSNEADCCFMELDSLSIIQCI